MGQAAAWRGQSWVNIVLIGLNVVYFLWLEMIGSSQDVFFMLRHGAMYAPLVVEDHEYYRLLTAMFMHFGIEHLVNNMLVLFVLGDPLERALGKLKYLVLYLLSGVLANLASLLINVEEQSLVVSAGASGAIFGVIGGLLYVVIRNRGQLGELSTRRLVIAILFSLYFGFTSTGIDNAAHIAGLAAGAALALILYRKPEPRRGTGENQNRMIP